MKIGVHQMCSSIDSAKNAANMVDAITQAAAAGASLYFAPEMSLLLDRNRERAKSKIRFEAETPLLQTICNAARNAGIWVHIGSVAVLHEDRSGRFANRTLVIDDMGEIRARYDKIHMFDVNLASGEQWRESAAYRPGNTISAVGTPWGLLGLTICYDIRFASLYTSLSEAGVDIIAVPAAFTKPTGQAHWETLLRARAIETQTFVVAAAQVGTHEDGRSTYGHSLVVGPWGDIIADLGEEEAMALVDLDMGQLEQVRSQIPVRKSAKDLPSKFLLFD